MRRLGLLLVLLSLLWQSVAFAGSPWMAVPGEDNEHAALHWEREAHHHHDDGGYHVGDTIEAFAHVHFDGSLQMTALLGDTFCPAPLPCACAPDDVYQSHLPAPPPDGLRRPPRIHA